MLMNNDGKIADVVVIDLGPAPVTIAVQSGTMSRGLNPTPHLTLPGAWNPGPVPFAGWCPNLDSGDVASAPPRL